MRTKREIFDIVKAHLLAQGARATAADGSGGCLSPAYYAPVFALVIRSASTSSAWTTRTSLGDPVGARVAQTSWGRTWLGSPSLSPGPGGVDVEAVVYRLSGPANCHQ